MKLSLNLYGQVRAKLVWNWEQNMLYTKNSNFFVKKVSILTGLKVPSLTCKCVYCRPKHAKEEPQGTEFRKFWNKEMKYTNG